MIRLIGLLLAVWAAWGLRQMLLEQLAALVRHLSDGSPEEAAVPTVSGKPRPQPGTWVAVYRTQDGALYSWGQELADQLPEWLDWVEIPRPPIAGWEWEPETLSFVHVWDWNADDGQRVYLRTSPLA